MPEQITLAPARHEPEDVGPRLIWAGAALVLATVLVLIMLVFWLFPKAIGDRTLHLPLAQYPNPQLQPDARADWAKFYASEMQALNGTGWVDKAHGVVHIPIADAMRKVAREGIPGWPAPPEKQP
ncbi:MAG TPA: hypothetical protein VFC56_16715 [Stellaceae bacterium]|nr:hypothetical protein [Stellaceae bacterium]